MLTCCAGMATNTVLPNKMCIDAMDRPRSGCSFFKEPQMVVLLVTNQGHYMAVMAW